MAWSWNFLGELAGWRGGKLGRDNGEEYGSGRRQGRRLRSMSRHSIRVLQVLVANLGVRRDRG